MSFFDDIRRRLFKGSVTTTGKLLHEPIVRSEKELKDREAWNTGSPGVLDQLKQAYHYRQADLPHDWQVHLLDSPSAKGLALSYPEGMGKLGFMHLFDLLGEQVQGMGYRRMNHDRQIKDKGQFMETRERTYLKPPLSHETEAIDQHYGNVLIERVLEDDHPRYLKVVVSTYHDHLYQPAREFSEFLDRLLVSSSPE